MKPKQIIWPVLFTMLTVLFCTLNSNAQVDHYYGLNYSGLRVSVGAGITTLKTHYNSRPAKSAVTGRIEYDFNPYFTIGIEGQKGTLYGEDTNRPAHQYYSSSSNAYYDGNFNIKAAVGLFYDFDAHNALMDAIKRIYVGAGIGAIHNKITLTVSPDPNQVPYGQAKTTGNLLSIPFNIGTNIDLPNVLGTDRLSINPNFQFSYIPSLYTDGFQANAGSSLKGFYNFTSISLKYKF